VHAPDSSEPRDLGTTAVHTKVARETETHLSQDLLETVTRLLDELDGPTGAGAMCSLASLPSEALRFVGEPFHGETNGQGRQSLIHALWQCRDAAAALPTLAAALRTRTIAYGRRR
jgi:hypothetical protein